jgi:uncharacterized protein
MRVGLLSDTHGFLDPAILEYFADRDEIWHAGDFGTAEVFDRLGAFKPVRGVYGNIDGPEIRERAPADQDWSVDGLRVYMVHIGGYPGRYEPHARRELERRKPGLFICGHSHIARVMRDERLRLLHLNPGAAGHAGWHVTRTAMRFEVAAAEVSNIELVELGKRGKGG